MRSMFNLALEGADSTDSLSGDSTPTPVNEAGLLEGAMEDYAEMRETESSVDKLIEGQDNLTEIVEVAQESLNDQGLSPRSLSILKLVVKNIVGKNIASRSIPSMESYDITHPKQVTAIALEGVTDTIKQFWQAIKNQMGKFWNQTKAWYLKTFDVSNKIISRAKALEEKAGQLSTVATEKSFEYSGANFIKFNNDVKNTANVIKGLKNVRQLLDEVLLQLNTINQNDKSEKVLTISRNKLTAMRSAATKNAVGANYSPAEYQELLQALTDSIEPESSIIKMATIDVKDAKMLEKLGVAGNQNVAVKSTDVLSGDMRLYRCFDPNILSVKGNNVNISQFTEHLKNKRFVLTDATPQPRTMDDNVSVPTLNASQIVEIAGTCGEVGEIIGKYKQSFEARDKYISKLVKGFDQIIKDLDGTDVQHSNAQSQGSNHQRSHQAQSNFVNAQRNQNNPQQPAQQPQQAPATESADSSTPAPAPENKANDSVDKDIRRLANTMMANFKKSVSISGVVITHSIKVANAFLTYGERSLTQYGG